MSGSGCRITTMKLIRDLLGDVVDVVFAGVGIVVCLVALLVGVRFAF